MSRKIIRKIGAAILCAVIGASGSAAVFAADKVYSVPELDNMQISLPENMSAVTRSANSNDRYFSLFGLDYNSTMSNFESGNIYLQGMDSLSAITVTVTMTETEESDGIKNYNLLQSDKLGEVARNFLNNDEYTACTVDEAEKNVVWLNFNVKVNNINTYQANTVAGGKSISVTLQRNGGDVTASDYSIFNSIVSSISFGQKPIIDDYITYIIIGAAVLAIVILLIVIIVAVRSGKRKRKRTENDKLLEELADKYTRKNQYQPVESSADNHRADDDRGSYFAEPEKDNTTDKGNINYGGEYGGRFSRLDTDDVIREGKSEDFTEALPEESEEELITETVPVHQEKSIQKEEKAENQADVITGEDDGDFFSGANLETEETDREAEEIFEVIETEEVQKAEKTQKISEDAKEETETSEDEDEETDELEEYMNDEVLVREDIKKNRFNDSDDFFDEAPKKTFGVISSKEIADAEEYDVIGEVEKRVSEVEKESVSRGETAADTLKKIGGGIKSFFIHCGYFITNVKREIKRSRARKKRKKAEEERRRRARERAAAQRAQARQRENGGLVQVRSRGDGRPPQKSGSQRNPQRRPSQKSGSQRNPQRRPSQNSSENMRRR